jgi:hypothetical protein
MADKPWTFDESARRYRGPDGRFLSASGERALRDDFLARKQAETATLAGRVARQEITVQQWEKQMQRVVQEAHGVQYAYGAGGRRQVTDDGWRQLSDVVGKQHEYLRNFAEQLKRGELTEAQIAARAGMYADAANASYWQGKATTYDGLDLPGQPGIGTACLTNCRCAWEIVETDTEWQATWNAADDGGTCGTCADRASMWNPYVQARMVEVAA